LYHRSGSFICFTHFDGVWNETSIDEPSTRRALSSSQPEHVHCAADEHSLSPMWCIAVLSMAGTTNEPLGVYLHSPPNCAGAPTRHVSPSQCGNESTPKMSSVILFSRSRSLKLPCPAAP